MRPSYDSSDVCGTPIYDALYAEYRRLFRALPGDRSGEEDLRFTGFGPATHLPPGQEGGQEVRTLPDLLPQAARQPRGNQPALPPGPADNRMRGL